MRMNSKLDSNLSQSGPLGRWGTQYGLCVLSAISQPFGPYDLPTLDPRFFLCRNGGKHSGGQTQLGYGAATMVSTHNALISLPLRNQSVGDDIPRPEEVPEAKGSVNLT